VMRNNAQPAARASLTPRRSSRSSKRVVPGRGRAGRLGHSVCERQKRRSGGPTPSSRRRAEQ
jgi:hypothetical protein